MNNAISAADVREYLSAHLNDVFETMLSLKAEPGTVTEPFQGEHVCGTVGLAGEKVTVAVYLHMSSSFARQAAAAMLGLAPEELTGVAEINDVVAEMTNMLGGGVEFLVVRRRLLVCADHAVGCAGPGIHHQGAAGGGIDQAGFHLQ